MRKSQAVFYLFYSEKIGKSRYIKNFPYLLADIAKAKPFFALECLLRFQNNTKPCGGNVFELFHIEDKLIDTAEKSRNLFLQLRCCHRVQPAVKCQRRYAGILFFNLKPHIAYTSFHISAFALSKRNQLFTQKSERTTTHCLAPALSLEHTHAGAEPRERIEPFHIGIVLFRFLRRVAAEEAAEEFFINFRHLLRWHLVEAVEFTFFRIGINH